MTTIKEEVEILVEENPKYRQRKYRYEVIEQLTGVSKSTAKRVVSIYDTYRRPEISDKDSVGEKIEKTYHKSDIMHKFDNVQQSLINIVRIQ